MKINVRKFKESDAANFQAAILGSVDHLSSWMSWCTPSYSIEDATQWASSSQKTWEEGTDYRFLIEGLDTEEILGSVGINQIVAQHKVGNLGYWVRESAINKGVCTQAAKKVVEFAFSELGFQRIEIHILVDNLASNTVAARIGAQYEGIFRNKLMLGGHSLPAKCYSIIPSDYGY